MRKIALLGVGLFMSFSLANAQDTLIFEDFNDTIIGSELDDFIDLNYPNAIVGDTMWYSYDEDNLPDQSGASRPDNWYLVGGGFYGADTLDICLMSSSWTLDPNPVKNWFILPAIQITDGASAWLKWKSAPRQTPLYLDGYKILISTGDNDLPSFTNTVFTAAEYETGTENNGNNYALYTFSSGWVHGLDGNYIDCTGCLDDPDSARFIGIQRPDSISLAAYDNQMIYIAFLHETVDDNLISIDDILVIENTDIFFDVEQLPDFAGSVYPNPASDYINVTFDIETYHNASVQMMNNSGQIIYTSPLTEQNHRISLQNVASGVYYVKLLADEGTMVRKIVVTK